MAKLIGMDIVYDMMEWACGVIIPMSLMYVGADILFMEDPTVPPPGLAELDSDMQRETVLRWLRDQNLGDCPLVRIILS